MSSVVVEAQKLVPSQRSSDEVRAVQWSYGHDRARSALEPFDALIGTWATEATHPLFDAVVPGSITFEWFEGGHFLVQRSHNDHELFPDASASSAPPRPATGWSWSTSTRAACAGRTASRSTTACCASCATTRVRPALLRTPGHNNFEGRWQLARTLGDCQET